MSISEKKHHSQKKQESGVGVATSGLRHQSSSDALTGKKLNVTPLIYKGSKEQELKDQIRFCGNKKTKNCSKDYPCTDCIEDIAELRGREEAKAEMSKRFSDAIKEMSDKRLWSGKGVVPTTYNLCPKCKLITRAVSLNTNVKCYKCGWTCDYIATADMDADFEYKRRVFINNCEALKQKLASEDETE